MPPKQKPRPGAVPHEDNPFVTAADVQNLEAAVRFTGAQHARHEALFQKMLDYSMRHVEVAAQTNALLRELVAEVKIERAELTALIELFTGKKTNGGGDHVVDPPSGNYPRKVTP
jgi:hypothetical protein